MAQTISRERLLALLHARIKQYGSQRAAAASLGISQPYLNDILRGVRGGGPKVLAALGYEKKIVVSKIPA